MPRTATGPVPRICGETGVVEHRRAQRRRMLCDQLQRVTSDPSVDRDHDAVMSERLSLGLRGRCDWHLNVVPRNDHAVLDGVTLDVVLATELCRFAVCSTVFVDDLAPNLFSLLGFFAAIQDFPLEPVRLRYIAFRDREVQRLLRSEPDPSGKHAAQGVRAEAVLGYGAVDGQAVPNIHWEIILDELFGVVERIRARSLRGGVGCRNGLAEDLLPFCVNRRFTFSVNRFEAQLVSGLCLALEPLLDLYGLFNFKGAVVISLS